MAADLQIFDVKIFCCNDSVFGKDWFVVFHSATIWHIDDMVYLISYQYDRTGLAPGWITNCLTQWWKIQIFNDWMMKRIVATSKWASLLKIISNWRRFYNLHAFLLILFVIIHRVTKCAWSIDFFSPLCGFLSHLMLEMNKINHENLTCNAYISTKSVHILWKVTS